MLGDSSLEEAALIAGSLVEIHWLLAMPGRWFCEPYLSMGIFPFLLGKPIQGEKPGGVLVTPLAGAIFARCRNTADLASALIHFRRACMRSNSG
jgi:hypothetical protein